MEPTGSHHQNVSLNYLKPFTLCGGSDFGGLPVMLVAEYVTLSYGGW
jgi:hypothetical protein